MDPWWEQKNKLNGYVIGCVEARSASITLDHDILQKRLFVGWVRLSKCSADNVTQHHFSPHVGLRFLMLRNKKSNLHF